MSLPSSHLAFSDCYETFERALETKKGIRVQMDTEDKAYNFRMRLQRARTIDRKRNLEVYEPGHELHGCSPFDPIQVRVLRVDGTWYVYLNRVEVPERIESLDDIPEVEPDKVEREALVDVMGRVTGNMRRL